MARVNHTKTVKAGCLLALGLLSSVTALSAAAAEVQTQDPEVIVVTASGIEQRIVDAPASISVVSKAELELKPYITLIDAVRELEGVDVGETSDKTGQRTISMRGMGSDYTLILIDGRRQNNHGDIYPNSFGGNQFNHIPPLDMIERIEVIRGPASTLYGADALGGVINIITRKVADRWTGSATAGRSFQQEDMYGTDTTYDFAVQGPLIQDRLGLSLRGSRYERDASLPQYEKVTDPDGVEHERALGFGGGGRTVNNVNESLGASLNWIITENHNVVLEYDTSEQVYDNTPTVNNLGTLTYPLGTVDGLSSIWASAPRVGYSDDQRFTRDQWSVAHTGNWGFGTSLVSLSYLDTGNHGRTLPFTVAERQLHTRIFRGQGAYAGMSEAERKAIMEATFLPRPKREMNSRQYTLDAKLDVPIEGYVGRHHLVVGGQMIDGELEDGVYSMEASSSGAGVVQDHEMWAVFAEDNWTPIDPLTITAGVRYDNHNLFGGNVSPRVYGVYTVSDEWTVKGGVSTGFKTPKTSDLFDGVVGFGGQGTSPFFGNPDLKPETSMNQEIGVYWTGNEGHSFNVTYFINDFEDKISSGTNVPDCARTGGVRPCVNIGSWAGLLNLTDARQSINIDKAEVKGAEVVGRYQIMDNLSVRLNYTLTDSEQKSGAQKGLPLTNTAKHMANATLDWRLTPALSMQLMSEYRSRRYNRINATTGEADYWKEYSVMHLGGQYQFTPNVTLTARINNLLDKDFTTFDSSFVLDPVTNEYSLTATDHYNNKDKARNFWVSLNLAF